MAITTVRPVVCSCLGVAGTFSFVRPSARCVMAVLHYLFLGLILLVAAQPPGTSPATTGEVVSPVDDAVTQLASEMVAEGDTDGDGSLNLEEFTGAVLDALKESLRRDDECICHASNSFRLIDTGEDERVDQVELQALFKYLDALREEPKSGGGIQDVEKEVPRGVRALTTSHTGSRLQATHRGIPILGGARRL